MSDKGIWTKPLARRTLSRVRVFPPMLLVRGHLSVGYEDLTTVMSFHFSCG